MKNFLIVLLMCCLFGCLNENKTSSDKLTDEVSGNKSQSKSKIFESEEQEDYSNVVFNPILNTKERKDKKNLKTKLLQTYKKILSSKSVISDVYYSGVYGAEDSLWVVEIKEDKDSSCLPAGKKIQLLFNNQGQLIHVDSAAYLKWVKFKKDKNPLLMTLNSNCSGKGQHHFYKYENGSMVDIFNVLFDSTPNTYDTEISSDNTNYEPAELEMTLEDLNEDGKNDLVFSGVKQIYENKNLVKTQAIRFTFIYEPNEDWFVLKNSVKKDKPKK